MNASKSMSFTKETPSPETSFVVDHEIFGDQTIRFGFHDVEGKHQEISLSLRRREVECTKFCFHNPYSTPETVSFYIHLLLTDAMFPPFSLEHLDPVNVKIAELREALESVVAEQKYLKHVILVTVILMRSTRAGEKAGDILHSRRVHILAAASGLQVLYIRKLFSKSVAYNRV
ncbi:hypothetical protein HID58_094808 [Brassica napus]|uniref:GOLD domain-containing protein n=1 Tax=Brassica napus TaxID=3708 RepID=A0ABQ7X8C3_BRANA|nr:hypothetical protein HID58_094808 [Brassica napus]